MANHHWKLLAAILLMMASSSTTMTSAARNLDSKSTLLARLKLNEEGSKTCLDALLELKSCSGEVVLFFLNGETSLGPNCCSAIRTIEHQCWPSMMGTLGITAEEGDILRGYCDAAEHGGSTTTTTATPPPSAVAAVHQCYNLPRLVPAARN
ncbi:hypothetical protein ABFS82_08G197600 [Erythranthe guttata]|nr:PREDICTED: egg cell-secreted protein 1.1-like [Erythranthe guttata]|eukprot:XP_012852895.1 PREDICTED: egg cell-secreted protein 1.1-like [Erythranthe guttata]